MSRWVRFIRKWCSPTTKDVRDVLHTPDALDTYLDEYLVSQGLTFGAWVARFAGEPYASRNAAIVELLHHRPPHAVFEFACAAGYLAEAILTKHHAITRYTVSNFSPRMVDLTAA